LDTPARVTNFANLNELKGKKSPLEGNGNNDRSRNILKKTRIGEVPTSIHRMKKPHRARCGNNRENPGPIDRTSLPAGLGLDMNQGQRPARHLTGPIKAI